MNSGLVTILLLTSEIGLVMGVILALITVFQMRRKRKQRELAKAFINQIRVNEDEFVATLRLQDKIIEETDNSNRTMDERIEAVREEKRAVCILMLNLFLQKKPESILTLENELNTLIFNARDLIREEHEQAEALAVDVDLEGDDSAGNEQLQNEIKMLKEENERLKTQLADSMSSFERISEEYSSMFSKEQEDNDQT